MWRKRGFAGGRLGFAPALKERLPTDFSEYVTLVKDCISVENGKLLANLLSFRKFDAATKKQILSPLKRIKSDNIWVMLKTKCASAIPEPWDMIVYHLCRCHKYQNVENWSRAVGAAKMSSDKVLELMKDTRFDEASAYWYLQVINTVVSALAETSVALHSELVSMEDAEELATGHYINEAFNIISQYTRQMVAEQSIGGSKLSRGLFFTVNKMLRLSDAINNETYYGSALSLAEGVADIHAFPLSDVVTHLFYAGKHATAVDDLRKAKEKLTAALRLCHKDAFKNKVRILTLLIPVSVLHGEFPRRELLVKYGLYRRMWPLVEAVKTGDLVQFQKALFEFESDLINSDCYLLWQKAEALVFRRLVEGVYLLRERLRRQRPEDCTFSKAQMIPTTTIISALKAMGYTATVEEVESRLALLIHKKLIKGYIAPAKALVLASVNPFSDLKHNSMWYKT